MTAVGVQPGKTFCPGNRARGSRLILRTRKKVRRALKKYFVAREVYAILLLV
jgi:hypothetical protein